MAPTDAQRIEHILESIETIEERVADLDESTFVADDVVHDAVLYQLALLGEAANSLSSGCTHGILAFHGRKSSPFGTGLCTSTTA